MFFNAARAYLQKRQPVKVPNSPRTVWVKVSEITGSLEFADPAAAEKIMVSIAAKANLLTELLVIVTVQLPRYQ